MEAPRRNLEADAKQIKEFEDEIEEEKKKLSAHKKETIIAIKSSEDLIQELEEGGGPAEVIMEATRIVKVLKDNLEKMTKGIKKFNAGLQKLRGHFEIEKEFQLGDLKRAMRRSAH